MHVVMMPKQQYFVIGIISWAQMVIRARFVKVWNSERVKTQNFRGNAQFLRETLQTSWGCQRSSRHVLGSRWPTIAHTKSVFVSRNCWKAILDDFLYFWLRGEKHLLIMILMLLTTAMTMRDTWMEVGGGSLFNWLRFREMCVNGEQRRVPEGRKQRAGESCVELLQEGGES